jgi:hypothetical protein
MVFNIIGYTYITQAGTSTSTTQFSGYQTISLTAVMCGAGFSFTPLVHGNVLITIDGSANLTSSCTGGTITANYGSGSAPASGAATTGTVVSYGVSCAVTTAGVTTTFPFSITRVITGLTAGVTYWIDLSILAVGTDYFGVSDVSCTTEELGY